VQPEPQGQASSYLALLRGINVGGKNIIPMSELRSCFTDLGATEVATYIQSGNVVFDGGTVSADGWIEQIERALSARFGYSATVVVRSHADLKGIVFSAPDGFGTEPDRYRSDVLFLMEPLAPTEVLAAIKPRDGVDRAAAGPGVVYFDRLTARATQSRLTKVIGLPIYKRMTIRNWRTTTRLLEMLDERAG
jgi:uncharacterized protein (DUF1697 family)